MHLAIKGIRPPEHLAGNMAAPQTFARTFTKLGSRLY